MYEYSLYVLTIVYPCMCRKKERKKGRTANPRNTMETEEEKRNPSTPMKHNHREITTNHLSNAIYNV